jgi:hypothetical protein
MSVFPPSVQRLLTQLDVDTERVAMLSFSASWELMTHSGALLRLGLDTLSADDLSTAFKDICIGLSRLRGTHLPQLELPSGGTVDLHLVAEPTLFHAVLIDVRESVEAARAAQQALQNVKLEVMTRIREVAEARQKLTVARQRNSELQRQLLVQQQCSAAVRAQLAALHVELQREIEQVSVRATAESGMLLAARRAQAASERLAPLLAQLTATPTLLLSSAPIRERVDLEQLAALCIDGATQLAREHGQGFEMRLNRRSTEIPLFNTALLRVIVCCAITQAQLRCSAGLRVDVQLRWDGSSLKLDVTAPVAQYTEAERACLWDSLIADPADPVLACLLALGVVLQRVQGRATVASINATQQCLSLSVAQASRDGDVTERLFTGGRVWLLAADTAQAEVAEQRLLDLGFAVEMREFEGLIDAALRHVPDAVLIDSALEGAVRSAFQLKGRGYRGRVLALGTPPDTAVARSSFDATIPLSMEPDALVRAIRGPGR